VRRQEAISLLARILASCEPDNVTFISLDHPNPKSSFGLDDLNLVG
jgi:hypothetical protein